MLIRKRRFEVRKTFNKVFSDKVSIIEWLKDELFKKNVESASIVYQVKREDPNFEAERTLRGFFIVNQKGGQ